ncbi:sulfite exporter TauE/SafE family protein [Ramlibacter sp. PS4R-6]|uniref:sulfite exporter TauE/SafE family protein n=1 Tax=Ramlibacter sp. PS4R-6 TaxID=3133438 RepID=UPI00309A1B4B
MSATLAATALVMGLAGGPHCTAMCGAACAGVVRFGKQPKFAPWVFQAGRLAGYSAAGAVAAETVQGFAWLASQTAALRPVWTLFHLAVLAWGLMLLTLARQPMWVGEAGRAAWARMRPVAGTRGGLFTAGALWALMPCGLLYSALLVASLSGGALDGALSMALFALGSGAWLAAAPRLLAKLRERANHARQDWGTRISGLLLSIAAVFALWVDLAHRVAQWCGLAP